MVRCPLPLDIRRPEGGQLVPPSPGFLRDEHLIDDAQGASDVAAKRSIDKRPHELRLGSPERLSKAISNSAEHRLDLKRARAETQRESLDSLAVGPLRQVFEPSCLDRFQELIKDRSAMSPARANQAVYKLLKDGVKFSHKPGDDEDQDEAVESVRLIDWNEPQNNDFFLASQFWISGDYGIHASPKPEIASMKS